MTEQEKPKCAKCGSINRRAFVCLNCRRIEWLKFLGEFFGIGAVLAVGGWLVTDAWGRKGIAPPVVLFLAIVLIYGGFTIVRMLFRFVAEVSEVLTSKRD